MSGRPATHATEPLVAKAGTHLQDQGGRPWFYLADTAWQLFQSLNRDEADHYLATRAKQGFNVIQAVAYPEFGGIDEPNALGDLAMHDGDPARPNEAYFDHVAWGIERAAGYGLTVALLPTWGCHVNPAWATNRVANFNPESASAYGAWLAKRLDHCRNLIWVIGGDRPIEDDRTRQVWDALAQSIRNTESVRRIMAFHPPGGTSSSRWFNDADWLDMHWIQSGHWRQSIDNHAMVLADLEQTPRRPAVDAEPCYENHPVGMDPSNPWLDDHDVRRAAWQAVFAGACGHAYGCHDVWMMATQDYRPVPTSRGTWRQSLNLPGASQMAHVRRFAESRLLPNHFADPTLCPMASFDTDRIVCTRNGTIGDHDATIMAIYSPLRRPKLTVNASCVGRSNRLRIWWFDPRTGAAVNAEEASNSHTKTGVCEYDFPEGGPDWVFVIEHVDKYRAI